MTQFRALLMQADGRPEVTEIDDDRLPAGDVTVDVEYSTLNYKDGLIVTRQWDAVKRWPHVAGIDFAGTVTASDDPRHAVGDKVVLTGWRVGEMHWGGYATRARVKGDWLVALPKGLSTRDAMALGTAGFTAMLAVMALEDHGLTEGEVLVTGASGGVGSVAVALLAALGHTVVASSGREAVNDYLLGLGATRIVSRADLAEPPARPVDHEQWAGCIDSVGGMTLARVLTQMRYGTSVAAVGLASGAELSTTVLPFLLRGMNLLGIDSVMCPVPLRQRAWDRIAQDMPMDKIRQTVTEVGLGDVPDLAEAILKGGVRGRTVVNVTA
ncbi:MDR family oxidoreductase [Falsirhodobacter sp. 20TX0035]|uniref:MDR family oxidoreductase n=1 Tax=Falsirhodobacter sp. 20TX0035 TaxID=3022019 RepID=UPI00232C4678|nr:MDR family oxidoreductase [Falsirhodobacter sp. 20TX0035]MDB6452118.1 oxidoreductase [Falsirhodobacter sp. 20TX0035]